MKKVLATLARSPRAQKIVGVMLIVIGVAALVTPLTPGSWLALIGFELLGVHLVLPRRLGALLKRTRRKNT